MTLTLFYHPLSSFSWKVLIALYESGIAFEPRLVDFGNEASRRELAALWPLAKIPVLRDDDTGEGVAETSIILEHLAERHEGAEWLLPSDPATRLRTRFVDRVVDLHLHAPVQRIVADRLRPPEARDAFGVDAAHRDLRAACALVEGWLRADQWAVGETFTLADCAAAPALHYADKLAPLRPDFPQCAGYLARLEARPSFARVLQEARPYAHLFPAGD